MLGSLHFRPGRSDYALSAEARCWLRRGLLLVGAVAGSLVAAPWVGQAQERPLLLATAPVAGLSFPLGGAICAAMNRPKPPKDASADAQPRPGREPVACAVVPTSGSEENLTALLAGHVDAAIVQADWLYYAKHGLGSFAGQTEGEQLRSLFNLQPQILAVVVKANSPARDIADLKGMTVNIGSDGSAQRALSEILLGTFNLSPGDFKRLTALPVGAQEQAFCAGAIDAFIQPASQPVATIAAVLDRCQGRLLAIDGRRLRGLVRDNPFYQQMDIPAGSYRDQETAIPSMGLHTVLVTRRNLSEAAVERLVTAVAGDLEGFSAEHPAIPRLTWEQMFDHLNFMDAHSGLTDVLTKLKLGE